MNKLNALIYLVLGYFACCIVGFVLDSLKQRDPVSTSSPVVDAACAAPEQIGLDCTGTLLRIVDPKRRYDFGAFRSALVVGFGHVESASSKKAHLERWQAVSPGAPLDLSLPGRRYLRFVPGDTGAFFVLPTCRRVAGCCL